MTTFSNAGGLLGLGKNNTEYARTDDDRRCTLKQLLRINDSLFQLCKSLTDKRDIETSSRLIPLVDGLTDILIEAGKNRLH